MPYYVWTRERKLRLIADSVALVHFVFANFIFLVGQLTGVFAEVGGRYPGLKAVYLYLDRPVYTFLRGFADRGLQGEMLNALAKGQVVIIASSLVYGFLAWLLARIVVSIFLGPED